MNSVCVEYQSYNRMMSLVLCAWGGGVGGWERGALVKLVHLPVLAIHKAVSSVQVD